MYCSSRRLSDYIDKPPPPIATICLVDEFPVVVEPNLLMHLSNQDRALPEI